MFLRRVKSKSYSRTKNENTRKSGNTTFFSPVSGLAGIRHELSTGYCWIFRRTWSCFMNWLSVAKRLKIVACTLFACLYINIYNVICWQWIELLCTAWLGRPHSNLQGAICGEWNPKPFCKILGKSEILVSPGIWG